VTRTVPVMEAASVGDLSRSDYWNLNVRNLGQFATAPPLYYGAQATTQSLSNSTWTNIGFDSTDYDSDFGHSNSTNNNRYVVQHAGWYRVSGIVVFAANATGSRGAAVVLNGSLVSGSLTYAASGNATEPAGASTSYIVSCAVNDWVGLAGIQTSGGALSTAAAGGFNSSLTVQWVSVPVVPAS
jgi:hypothetical protein